MTHSIEIKLKNDRAESVNTIAIEITTTTHHNTHRPYEAK